jgi:hypothetical protein
VFSKYFTNNALSGLEYSFEHSVLRYFKHVGVLFLVSKRAPIKPKEKVAELVFCVSFDFNRIIAVFP